MIVDYNPSVTTKPPYYSSYDGPFGGYSKYANFSDSPCYNSKEVGKIVFYTVFSETLKTDPDPRKQEYSLKSGVKWGIEMNQHGKIMSSPLYSTVDSEIKNILNVLKENYTEALFRIQ